MKNARYDIPKLRRTLRELATELRSLKEKIRAPRYLPSWKEYRDLKDMKKAFTALCCLRAHHRGRSHLQNKEKSLELVQLIEKQYTLQEQVAA